MITILVVPSPIPEAISRFAIVVIMWLFQLRGTCKYDYSAPPRKKEVFDHLKLLWYGAKNIFLMRLTKVRVAGCGLRATDCGLRVAGHRLRAAELRATDCGLRATGMRAAGHRLRAAGHRLQAEGMRAAGHRLRAMGHRLHSHRLRAMCGLRAKYLDPSLCD